MPIYEYHCDRCGRDFDVWQKITSEPITECEECGGHVSKQISRTSFQLKGTGWYVTDYGRKGGGGSSSKASTSTTSSSPSSSSTESSSATASSSSTSSSDSSSSKSKD